MLGPDSRLLTALLIAASAALLVGAARLRRLPVKILCGAMSIVVAMVGGIAAVNYYYGYYTSWGQMWTDLHGSGGNLGVISSANTSSVESGHIGWTSLPGKLSGYNRQGIVYLPPQYDEARYVHVQFPVVELFHGSPGTPLAWETLMRIGQVANALLDRHVIGPMVLVMPAINGPGNDYQDCVNGPSLNDETYLLKDVRNDVFAHYRVSHDPSEWGAAGYSSGGFCAANLALRHRGAFGAAALINGYFRAADGPADAALGNNPSLDAANSPLYLAERLSPGTSPLPAFWVAAGANDKADYRPATVFTAALDRIEQVPFIKLNAGDSANAWSAALPAALTWLWQQLSAPDLRVVFPTRAQTNNVTTLPVPPVKRHHLGSCALLKPSRSAERQCASAVPVFIKAAPTPTALSHHTKPGNLMTQGKS